MSRTGHIHGWKFALSMYDRMMEVWVIYMF